MSLDGYTSGPNQSLEQPLGEGGEEIHGWVLATSSWRGSHGLEGGSGSGVDDERQAHWTGGFGATIMGRNMFGPIRGDWPNEDWRGWWGDEPPFHHPVFVLTHHARDPLEMQGGTTFTFVTDGIERALERAQRAAGEKDIALAGGAQAAQQYLSAGLVDEMQLHVVPILLGDGERLFDNVADLHGLALVETVATPSVVHLKFARE